MAYVFTVFIWALAIYEGLIALLSVVEALKLPQKGRHLTEGGSAPSVAVLVAAYNEADHIAECLDALLSSSSISEIVLVDDGSTDQTPKVAADFMARHQDSRVLITLLKEPHRGKGAALARALEKTTAEYVVTVDADTRLGPLAIEAITLPMISDRRVSAVAGRVIPRPGKNILSKVQELEYAKFSLARSLWARLSMLEQLPGSFTAIRRIDLVHAGGYPSHNITEDYEVSFALTRASMTAKKPLPVFRFAYDAVAFTEVPSTLASYFAQRSRWFAGFVFTLMRYRGLLLRPRLGRFGLIRLPVKWFEAALPALAVLLSLSALVRQMTAPSAVSWLPLLVTWISIRLASSAIISIIAARWSKTELGMGTTLGLTTLDALGLHWIRLMVHLRSYARATGHKVEWTTDRGRVASIEQRSDQPSPVDGPL